MTRSLQTIRPAASALARTVFAVMLALLAGFAVGDSRACAQGEQQTPPGGNSSSGAGTRENVPQELAPTPRREDSSWARFQPGAWRRDETRNYTLEAGQMTVQVRVEITTTLISVAADHYVLRVDFQHFRNDKKLMQDNSVEEMRGFDDLLITPAAPQCTSKNVQLEWPGSSGRKFDAREYICGFQDEHQNATKSVTQYANIKSLDAKDSGAVQLILRQLEVHDSQGQLRRSLTWKFTGDRRSTPEPAGVNWYYSAEQVDVTASARTIQHQTVSPHVPGGVITCESEQWSPEGEFVLGSRTQLMAFGLKPETPSEATAPTTGTTTQGAGDGMGTEDHPPTDGQPWSGAYDDGPQLPKYRNGRRGLFARPARGGRRWNQPAIDADLFQPIPSPAGEEIPHGASDAEAGSSFPPESAAVWPSAVEPCPVCGACCTTSQPKGLLARLFAPRRRAANCCPACAQSLAASR